MSDLYFKEESYYYKENTIDNEAFTSNILQLFQFEPEQKKTHGNESHEKKTKHIHASAADLLHIRIGNLDWSAMKASLEPSFMAICPTISHTC